MKKYISFAMFLIFGSLFAFADLSVTKDDVRLEYETGANFDNVTGFHLFIRKKPGMESVMLTESTKDPAGYTDNYAFRAMEYNSVNGDEVRVLDGKVLTSEYAKYSLIDSSAQPDPKFGMAFHIFIPNEMQYGYPWTRHGTVKIQKGTFINIRAFSQKYGEYEGGSFQDNAFMFNLGLPIKITKPEPEPVVELTDEYSEAAKSKFEEIVRATRGRMSYSKGPSTIIKDINNIIDNIEGKNTDIVFCIDATGSMKDDIEKLKRDWLPTLKKKMERFENFRVGLVFYRDYGDSYTYKKLPIRFFDFTTDLDAFINNIKTIKIVGREGGDVPEAVFEALYAGCEFYNWRNSAAKKIVLIGDAEPHPKPRGTMKISQDQVEELLYEKGIVVDAILLPHD